MKKAATITAFAVAALALPVGSAVAGIIDFSLGGGDLTFYYDSVGDSWDTVFRAKGDTTATGLTAGNIYGTPPGGVGGQVPANAGDPGDYTFSTLNVLVNNPGLLSLGGTDFYVTSASGSGGFNDNTQAPDLGIRTRLREDFGDGEVQQFGVEPFLTSVGFRLTLRPDLSTFNSVAMDAPGSPAFAIFDVDGFGSVVTTESQYLNTNDSDFESEWPNYTHSHRHFGFSEAGSYSLVFDIQGVDGEYGATASTGQFGVNFNVIPEPSSVLLIGFGGVAMALARRRRAQA